MYIYIKIPTNTIKCLQLTWTASSLLCSASYGTHCVCVRMCVRVYVCVAHETVLTDKTSFVHGILPSHWYSNSAFECVTNSHLVHPRHQPIHFHLPVSTRNACTKYFLRTRHINDKRRHSCRHICIYVYINECWYVYIHRSHVRSYRYAHTESLPPTYLPQHVWITNPPYPKLSLCPQEQHSKRSIRTHGILARPNISAPTCLKLLLRTHEPYLKTPLRAHELPAPTTAPAGLHIHKLDLIALSTFLLALEFSCFALPKWDGEFYIDRDTPHMRSHRDIRHECTRTYCCNYGMHNPYTRNLHIVYIYMYTYIYTYMYTHTHTYTYIHIYIHTHTYTYIYLCTNMYIYMYIHTWIFKYTHTIRKAYTSTMIAPTHTRTGLKRAVRGSVGNDRSTSLRYTHKYIEIHTCVYVYIYIYIHIQR